MEHFSNAQCLIGLSQSDFFKAFLPKEYLDKLDVDYMNQVLLLIIRIKSIYLHWIKK